MPRPVFQSKFSTSSVNIPTTTETAILTTDPIAVSSPGALIRILGFVGFLTGTATTFLTIRIRRGSGIAGALVGGAIGLSVAAAQNYSVPIEAEDTPGEVAGQQYTITAQQTAATGNGTATPATLITTAD